VTPAGTITTIAGTGRQGFSGDGGPATSARLHDPVGLGVDGRGDLYITDNGNNRVREVTPAGTITTFAGSGEVLLYRGDVVPPKTALIKYPDDLAVDGSGDVYIVVGNQDDVLKVGPSPTSGPLVWTALGSKVACGLAYVGSKNNPVLCDALPVPPPNIPPCSAGHATRCSEGDPGFVFLNRAGRPLLARLSQYTWVGEGAIRAVALRTGSTWSIRATGVTCTVGAKAVRCANRAHHGFTITRSSYRAF
jgi:hypothetical protein